MARADRFQVGARIVIERPVPGVLHSLQQDDAPLDPKASKSGEPLTFDFPLQIERTPDGGAKFFGPQVRREGPLRRFVYIRIGTSAGQHLSPWTRRMKIDIHDIDPTLLDKATAAECYKAPSTALQKTAAPPARRSSLYVGRWSKG